MKPFFYVSCLIMRPLFICVAQLIVTMCIFGEHHLHETIEHQRDSPKVNIFYAVFYDKVYDLFFLRKHRYGQSYLEMLHNWLFTLLQADRNDFIFQQDGHHHIVISGFELI